MAEERGWFDFAAVATAIHDKLVRRHPHVFAGTSPAPEELVRVWEEQKAQGARRVGPGSPGGEGTVLAGVPRALPALVRAAKLGRPVGTRRLDWPDALEVRAKVLEELHEMDGALAAAGAAGEAGADAGAIADELGDLLFSIVNWSRHLKLDAEARAAGRQWPSSSSASPPWNHSRAHVASISRACRRPSGTRCGAKQN